MRFFRFTETEKLDIIMAQLSDFQAQLGVITASIDAIGAEISTLKSNAASTMSQEDENTLLAQLQEIAAKLQAITVA